jgi:agmatinase
MKAPAAKLARARAATAKVTDAMTDHARPSTLNWNAGADEATVTLVAAPWDSSMSMFEHTGRFVHRAPERMVDLSHNMDLVDVDLVDLGLAQPVDFGIYFDGSLIEQTVKRNNLAAACLRPSRSTGNEPARTWGEEPHEPLSAASAARFDELWREHNAVLEKHVGGLLARGKLVAVLGGDHSCPLGAIKAFGSHVAAQKQTFGLLHIDAHLDLYDDFDGVQGSHACIMKRVLDDVPALDALVAVGIRELGLDEFDVHLNDPRHYIVSAAQAREWELGGSGKAWRDRVKEIVKPLPHNVWVSLDIDGLDLQYCAGTGTPVPGGLTYLQLVDLLLEIPRSGRVVCGFDLVETGMAPSGINTSARMAYKLAGLLMHGVGARDEVQRRFRVPGAAV